MATDPTQSVVLFREDASPCVVRVLDGPDSGRETALTSKWSLVGRSSHAQLYLSNTTVSDRHARVRRVAEGVEVEDLESTNGTSYLGTRIQRAVVPPGATVSFGSCRVAVVRVEPKRKTESPGDRYGSIWGRSAPMQELFAALERIEAVDFPVLVLGETGVGKELIAQEIHRHSKRSERPFVVCDCTSLSVTVAESELFGHVRGAFTDAQGDRKGLFELAHNGTLFLDEIGDLPAELQPKLLRVLETGQLRPVGASKTRNVNVRVVAATHRDLETEVEEGRFRRDLFFRLNPITLRIPPLRERKDDLPVLVERLMADVGATEVSLSENTVRLLCSGYDWPGNVRELRNALMHVCALGELPASVVEAAPAHPERQTTPHEDDDVFREAKRRAVEAFERDYLAAKLAAADGNVSEAARKAGLDRSRFRRLLKKHGLHDAGGSKD